jgi:tRNA nucleotidyltransferase (CCA-adding enzyme)
LLRDEFGSTPTIKYGGSKAKGTMIQESYDLDVVCYHESVSDNTLESLYNKTSTKLSEKQEDN